MSGFDSFYLDQDPFVLPVAHSYCSNFDNKITDLIATALRFNFQILFRLVHVTQFRYQQIK